jgi:hypothetical protein
MKKTRQRNKDGRKLVAVTIQIFEDQHEALLKISKGKKPIAKQVVIQNLLDEKGYNGLKQTA